MSENAKDHKPPWTFWLAVVASAVGGLFYFLLRKWRKELDEQKSIPPPPPDLAQFGGLSDEEAAERKSAAYEDAFEARAKQVRRRIWRNNTLSIFNVSLLGLASMQALLRDPLGALLTVGTLILNIGVNVFQELLSIRRVADLRSQVQPLATAVRAGRVKGIAINEVVEGDVLLVQEGDDFPSSGEILSGNQPIIFNPNVKVPEDRVKYGIRGDQITAGSQCLEGWAVYEASGPPPLELSGQYADGLSDKSKYQLTSLQRLIDRLLRWMLGVVVAFLIALVIYVVINATALPAMMDDIAADVMIYLDMPPTSVPSPSDMAEIIFIWARNITGLIFSLAPSGLFFMIVVAYAVGVADIGKFGALVRRAQTVEALAQVSTICISKGASLTGAEVQMRMLPSGDGRLPLPPQHVTNMIGSFARSQSRSDFILRALTDTFDGKARSTPSNFYFLNAFGWGAVNFTDVDLRGTYVLGHPAIIEPYLAAEGADSEESSGTEDKRGVLTRISGSVSRVFKRESPDSKTSEQGVGIIDVELGTQDVKNPERGESPIGSLDNENTEGDGKSPDGVLRRSVSRIKSLFSKDRGDDHISEVVEDKPVDPTVELTFAYLPEPTPIFDSEGKPQIPLGLIPLCSLTIIEQMRPEAQRVVKMFTEAGVSVKILAAEDAGQVERLGMQLGLASNNSESIVSGEDLDRFSDQDLEDEAWNVSLFSDLDATHKTNLVSALIRRGEFVAFAGDRVDDIPALRRSQVSITSLHAHRSALDIADIALIDASIESLTVVFQKGQRIVNGLMSALNLNLVQISYVLLLLIATFFRPPGPFFYHPTQGGMIIFFGVVLPGVGLTLWAPKGRAPRFATGRRLARFVLPAAITMTLGVFGISYLVYLLGMSAMTAQLAVTHTLVGMGLVLALFAQPPSKFWVGGKQLSGDRRILWMVLALAILWSILITIPLANELLKVSWLEPLWLHALVAAFVGIWMLVVRAIWRTAWIDLLFKMPEEV
jgi:magnesium-transporting ATPase (P-type)